MNVQALARTAYSNSRPTIRTDRSTEYDIFAHITGDLSNAIKLGDTGFVSLVRAMHENRRLWTHLAADVASEENALSDDLKAQIFYLAEFTGLHTDKVLMRDATADILIEINTSIMRGLRQNAGGQS